MKIVQLVLADIDGTLVDHAQHTVSEKVREAVLAVQAQGVELATVTGRPHGMAQQLLDELGVKGLAVFDGGASIRDVETGELVWSKWLDTATVRQIVEIVLPHADVIDFFEDYKEIPVANLSGEDVTAPAPYVFAFVHTEAVPGIFKLFETIPNISAHVGAMRRATEGFADIQIVHAEGDKFHGVQALREITHSDIAQTLAIGDGTNDLPLFANAGIKVAMGNAAPELKQAADHVVADLAQDGFAEAMRKFVLSQG